MPVWLRVHASAAPRTGADLPRLAAAWVALLVMIAAPAASHAQSQPLLTAGNFGVLAGSTVTNTGASVITGDVGVSPGVAITGFPPGLVNGTIHAADAVAAQAQADNTAAFNALAARPITTNLTGQNLGGMTLTAGVYGFNTSAQLTGVLTLNGQGNANSVFVFNIGSTLTTASASSVLFINSAQGANLYFVVGSSATLGTNTLFAGNILALSSITLTTGASINCGSALAQNGAVTLDTNNITVCQAAAPVVPAPPTPPPGNAGAVADTIAAFIANGGTLPPAFLNLLNFLTPAQLADAFAQLSGEAGTGVAPAGVQAMNSFLSLVTNPFDNNRPFNENPATPAMIRKALPFGGPAPDPRRWGIWAAGYGGQGNAAGDATGAGSHDRSVKNFGYATGLDYRVTPFTMVGFALAGGGTSYGLAEGFGSGHSDMFQAAVYTSTRIQAAYVSAAAAYAWHRVSSDRYLTLAGTDHLRADFSANSIGGRIEGGYRFAIPNLLGWPGQSGFTPYAAGQVQSFRTPSYSEFAVGGSPIFALTYDARTTTTVRSELGAWSDWSVRIDYGTTLVLRSRAAWAHDEWSKPDMTASFQALPGSSFVVTGAAPATDLLLASSSAEIWFANGFSAATRVEGEFAERSQKYAVSGRLRYVW
jgi:uncharacterized protein with beta-barrel porin domain